MEQTREKISFEHILIILLVVALLFGSVWLLLRVQRENLGEELDRANEYAARLAATVLFYGSSEDAGTDFVRYFDAENCELLTERPLLAYGEGTSLGAVAEERRGMFIRAEVFEGTLTLSWVEKTDEELAAEPALRGYREN